MKQTMRLLMAAVLCCLALTASAQKSNKSNGGGSATRQTKADALMSIKPGEAFVLTEAGSFGGGLAVVKVGEFAGVINSHGRVVLPFRFTELERAVHSWRFTGTRLDQQRVVVDVARQKDLPKPVNVKMKKLTAVKGRNGLIGFNNAAGVTVIPTEYEMAYSFAEGLAAVKKNGHWGFINQEGEEVIATEYDEVPFSCEFTEGLAPVRKGAHWAYVDHEGNPLEVVFDEATLEIFRQTLEDARVATQRDAYLKKAHELNLYGAQLGYAKSCFQAGLYYCSGYLGEPNYAEAVKWLEKATTAKGETDGYEYLYLGLCYQNGGYGISSNEKLAIKAFQAGASKKKNADCLNQLAYLYANSGRYKQAISTINKAIKMAPTDANYLDSKGEILLMMGRNAEAAAIWKRVIKMDPDFLRNHDSVLYKKLSGLGLI